MRGIERSVVVQDTGAGRDVGREHARAVEYAQDVERSGHQAQMAGIELILETYRVEIYIGGPVRVEVVAEIEPVDPIVLFRAAVTAGDIVSPLSSMTGSSRKTTVR